ncbi:MAG: GspE/PulE family protein [Planctomycetota bacterium]|jgi:type IV pilus assembly protein PilB
MAITSRELAEAAVKSRLIEGSILDRMPDWERLGRSEFVRSVTGAGRFPTAALYRAVAESRSIPYVDCDAVDSSLEHARRLPDVLLRRGLVLPVRQKGTLWIATADPDDRQTLATVQRLLGGDLMVALSEPEALRAASLRTLVQLGRALAEEAEFGHEDAIALLDHIMKEAYLRRASDVHLEPQEEGTRVRLRVDGCLVEFMRGLRPEEGLGLVSRVKVLAGLDIAEQRAAQDGGFTYRLELPDSEAVDIRAATIPTRLGERATLRLLGTASGDLTLTTLGMSDRDLESFREGIRHPHGIILLCGPTGSGKTTTLYAALREINRPEINIVTVEDPIEYKIGGVSQVHIGGGEKVTFAGSIRSLLRHDPDVMMVGEIRDAETADIALKAAMTGHLVLSTLHTNSAAGALTRLLDLECEPYRIAGTLIGAISQRLVRRLCSRCRTWRPASAEEVDFLGAEGEVAEPVGCARCLGTGYAGRIGIFEMLWIDRDLGRLIAGGAPEHELHRAARGRLRTLREDGLRKVNEGITAIGEVMHATLLEGED